MRHVPVAAAKAPLFIIGSPRSGTTFLTKMVNHFLDFHVSRDAGVFLRFHRMLSHYGDLRVPGNMHRLVGDMYADFFFRQRLIDRGLTLTADELCAGLTDWTYAGVVEHILMATARTHGKTGWGNKKPSYALSLVEVNEVFPRAKFVHIIRDGHDVALSMRKAVDSLFERNWYFAARDWQEHVLNARRMGQALGPCRYMEVTYERVCSDPAAVFDSILAFVDSPEEERRKVVAIGTGIRQEVKADNCYKWRSEVPLFAQRVIERTAGATLVELGYNVAFPHLVGKPVPLPSLVWFHVDRMGRKIFSRRLLKTFRYRFEQWRTRTRVVALRRPTWSGASLSRSIWGNRVSPMS
jgi:hypothetical protein